MTDRPIIFSAPMVRALLDGRKTMTRRLAWIGGGPTVVVSCGDTHGISRGRHSSPWQRVKPGDRLWVREAWSSLPRTAYHLPKTVDPSDADMAAYYRADFDRSGRPIWRPSIHMPRWASRLTLIVTATKIERLQKICEADARAEGVEPQIMHATFGYGAPNSGDAHDYARGFADLWDEINGPGSWYANPEIVAITFRVVRSNIDSAEARAA